MTLSCRKPSAFDLFSDLAIIFSYQRSPEFQWVQTGLEDNVLLQQGKRPLVLSRYGGYGNQRYPIGFSGDTERKWDTLHYQVSHDNFHWPKNLFMPPWGFKGHLSPL